MLKKIRKSFFKSFVAKVFFVFFQICCVAKTFVFAQETPIKGLFSYTLDNGLSLFVAENHAVPLAYVEIAVKCGSFTQTGQTQGLFHLYEHMMFKGNSLYKDAAAVNGALSDMGVAQWNGSTGVECVNYYFTIPAEKLEQGLNFWNAAIRSPKMDSKELENEKKVVLAEIQSNFSNQSWCFSNQKNNLMFSEAPWKLNPSGTVQTVQNASISQLKKIQKRFYIPNNSALFVGGDVNPDEVFLLVNKIFGSWKKRANPFEEKKSNPDKIVQFSKTPLEKPTFCVMPYERISKDIAEIEVSYRGPDCLFDKEDTYTADVLANLLSNPMGFYKMALTEDPLLFVPDPSYAWGGYYTRKTCGELSFGIMVQNPEMSLAERAEYFQNGISEMIHNIALQTDEKQMNDLILRVEDSKILESQTAQGLLETLRFWWTVADSSYYFSYIENLKSVNAQMIEDFNYKYFVGKNPLVTVIVNPEVFQKIKDDFEQKGFVIWEF